MNTNRILLVEDNYIQSESVREEMEALGDSVRAVYCGKTAFDAIDRREYFSALLTDIDLGAGPDGVDVARHARALLPHLPVVFMSGRSDGRHASHGIAGSEFVAKPFDVRQISDAVARTIDGEAARHRLEAFPGQRAISQ
jgi:DNA-binding NtrC family response regulator